MLRRGKQDDKYVRPSTKSKVLSPFKQHRSTNHLFNLANDNGEKNNLKEKEQLKFLKLKGLMNDWEKTVLPPIPLN